MNTPNCPKCGTRDDIEMVTVIFEHWDLDEEGNVRDIILTQADLTGDWSHFYCNICDEAFGLKPDQLPIDEESDDQKDP